MKTKLLYTFFILIAIILIAGSLFALWQFLKQRGLQEPPSQNPQAKSEEDRSARKEALLETIGEIFKAESTGTSYYVGIYDLKNDEFFGIDAEKSVHAASVSKILTAVYVFKLAEDGKVDLSEPMGIYNIETQVQYLLNQSSEDSWQLLDAKFKPKNQNAFAKKMGLKKTNLTLGKNKMSVKDVTILLKKLQKGEILSDSYKNRVLSYMQDTESENFFSPIFVQAELTFYHKTGKYQGEGHDAAIVEHDTNPFVLVVFTNNNSVLNPNSRGPVMTSVATSVLEYFNEY
jgi:beta-lactamase class A